MRCRRLARAVVNCRILPGESPSEVRSTLIRVLGRSEDFRHRNGGRRGKRAIAVEARSHERRRANRRIAMWPGVPVIPVMSTGATDGLYLRNAGIPTYGVSGFFQEVDDTRAHGRDERLGVKQFYEGREFLYRLVKALSS